MDMENLLTDTINNDQSCSQFGLENLTLEEVRSFNPFRLVKCIELYIYLK